MSLIRSGALPQPTIHVRYRQMDRWMYCGTDPTQTVDQNWKKQHKNENAVYCMDVRRMQMSEMFSSSYGHYSRPDT